MQCPRCNTKWPDEMAGMLKFCGACGAPLTTASNLTWQPPTTNKPGGELRFVTIVFADLAGFTSFAEDRPPDEVARIVGDLLQRLTKAVEENNGSVYQYLGDAVVAIFGLPVRIRTRPATRYAPGWTCRPPRNAFKRVPSQL